MIREKQLWQLRREPKKGVVVIKYGTSWALCMSCDFVITQQYSEHFNKRMDRPCSLRSRKKQHLYNYHYAVKKIE